MFDTHFSCFDAKFEIFTWRHSKNLCANNQIWRVKEEGAANFILMAPRVNDKARNWWKLTESTDTSNLNCQFLRQTSSEAVNGSSAIDTHFHTFSHHIPPFIN